VFAVPTYSSSPTWPSVAVGAFKAITATCTRTRSTSPAPSDRAPGLGWLYGRRCSCSSILRSAVRPDRTSNLERRQHLPAPRARTPHHDGQHELILARSSRRQHAGGHHPPVPTSRGRRPWSPNRHLCLRHSGLAGRSTSAAASTVLILVCRQHQLHRLRPRQLRGGRLLPARQMTNGAPAVFSPGSSPSRWWPSAAPGHQRPGGH